MAKRKYSSPVFLSASLLSFYENDSEDGTTGSGATASDFDELLSGLGITTDDLVRIIGTNWESYLESLGFEKDNKDTYWILEQIILG